MDCVVVGAGVIGLAIARQLAQAGHDTIILEREDSFGSITSARNSEVIHAGIYYPRDSLKARWCVRGNRLLYAYCEDHQVTTQACGKLIVATDTQQLTQLESILAHANRNQVPGMVSLSQAEAKKLEPELQCLAALYSPTTGIIDSHAYMLSLLGDFEDAGGAIAYRSPLIKAQALGEDAQLGFELSVGGAEPMQLRTRYLINCAGLSAPALAQQIEGLDHRHIPTAHFAKGNYFSLSGASPFRRLIYPIPEPGGLGVHLTLDLGGQAKFGPDVEWLDIKEEAQIDYRVDAARGDKFYAAVRNYWPGLQDGHLQAAYSGVRPKISGPDEAARDFHLQTSDEHGLTGLINLYGFESPGLTSSLAIAEHVAAWVEEESQ